MHNVYGLPAFGNRIDFEFIGKKFPFHAPKSSLERVASSGKRDGLVAFMCGFFLEAGGK